MCMQACSYSIAAQHEEPHYACIFAHNHTVAGHPGKGRGVLGEVGWLQAAGREGHPERVKGCVGIDDRWCNLVQSCHPSVIPVMLPVCSAWPPACLLM
eukprot:14188336-Alexandrium_andersonii.AAC.2